MDTKLKELLESEGYENLRVVDGKVCGIGMFITTVGVIVGMDARGYERRYCFQEYGDAIAALEQMSSSVEHLSGPWIKCKGVFQGEGIDLSNPNLEVF